MTGLHVEPREHRQARSTPHRHEAVSRLNGEVVIEHLVDNGVGGADSERGTGLRAPADPGGGARWAVARWTPPGGGTRVRADMPCV